MKAVIKKAFFVLPASNRYPMRNTNIDTSIPIISTTCVEMLIHNNYLSVHFTQNNFFASIISIAYAITATIYR